ncbi:DNA-binding SARP family transcriptional activator [Crossiella equi]|uniref:DNA-binding SARP family transcriptional activator n=1 Tax=Crossiella equi TaxID=130796 RepID=A0ABS5AS21_9PSEU|nr:BTAD domain-containing putative transcriptional regulator [Crossiella equi]MBP2479187.1 DNA-binding SARP family transcriptional activator [Crossiella equi]
MSPNDVLRFGVLGPVTAWRGDTVVDLGFSRQQCVLAVLLLELDRPVPVAALIDAVWGETPPLGVRNTVQTNISRLRRALGCGPRDGILARTDAGYVLRGTADQVDALAFGRELRAAQELHRDGDAGAALLTVESALRRWRGEPFAGLDSPYVRAQRTRLLEARLSAQELWVTLKLARGEHHAVLGQLTELADAHPLRERLSELLMLALYRAGRQAEALSRYQDTRAALVRSLGIDPGPGLRELHQRILAGDPGLRPRSAPARNQLPADTPAFTGRSRELAVLDGATGLFALDGMPGVGKTTLAVHAAHRLAPRFPDGQLFLRLNAFHPDTPPTDPADALAELLRAVGVPADRLPEGVPARSALWREQTRDRALLLVLDDATGHDQVRPLLPGPGASLVMVTSRRRLSALAGPHTLEVDPLSADEAGSLFLRLAGRRDDPVAVAELVALCGHLPLAITLLAGRLRHHPRWTTRYLVELLASSRTRLAEVHAEDLTLSTTFALSYLGLPDTCRALFRHLGLHPGGEIDVHASAALADLPVARTRRGLERLYGDHLLTEAAPGRYVLHDLLKDYAHSLADHTGPALRRLLEYYLHTTARISARVLADAPNPLPEPPCRFEPDPVVATESGALAWLDREHGNLTACVTLPCAQGHPGLVTSLATALHPYLRSRGHWHTAISLHQAARSGADPAGRAAALLNLGVLRRLTGDRPGSVRDLAEARTRFRLLGNTSGEAGALTELGITWARLGQYRRALGALAGARRRYRRLDSGLGLAHVFHHLGALQHRLGDLAGAHDSLTSALCRYRGLDNRLGQSHVLAELGVLHAAGGDLVTAGAHLADALAGYGVLGDRAGQARVLSELGEVHLRAGRRGQARGDLLQALGYYAVLDDPDGEAATRSRLRRWLREVPVPRAAVAGG